ncbi:MAG: CPBP family intramembrane metalloprotease [Muribaculaceae bacterium]|nr:CPBP family intramembrane metalloprotease [Muribaculaceae bacterium]
MAISSVTFKKLPLWKWMLLFIAAIMLAIIGYAILDKGSVLSIRFLHPCFTFVAAAIILSLYALLVRWIEGHWPTDLSLRHLVPHTLLGLLVGFFFMVLVVSTIVATGSATVGWKGFMADRQLDMFMMFLAVAVGEEMILRGVIFRWIDERWNTGVALLISAILFGWMHISNDNATWWSSLAIAIEAGLLLGAAYKWSGTLWVPIGIHWAWNYVQGNIFGLAVSGMNAGTTMLVTTANGPDIITGGAFGPEASIISVALGTFLTLVFLGNRYRTTRKQ